jgi:hypothetical protein
MAKYITLYHKIEGTDDILEKYIPTDEYKKLIGGNKECNIIESVNNNFLSNPDYINPAYIQYRDDYLPQFVNFEIDEDLGKNTMESLWKLKFYIYNNNPIPEDDYNQKIDDLFVALKKYYLENKLNIYSINKYILKITEQIFVYYLLKSIIKIEFPKKYIVAGPGNFINQSVPLFIIKDIIDNDAKWQIIIFGYDSITKDGTELDCNSGCIGDYIKNYIKKKIPKDKIKNIDIIVIDHGFERSINLEISYIFLPFIESQFDKLIVADTRWIYFFSDREKYDLSIYIKKSTINYNAIEYIIPNIIKNYINTNKIIFYNSYGASLLYYNKELGIWKKFEHLPKENNCNRDYSLNKYDTKCILDNVPLDIVLNNGFSILDTEKSKKGGYYKKYLKYKMKYISLKNKYMTRL